MTGAAGAGLHSDPWLSRLRVSEDSDRVTTWDNKQELRMRSVPGSGQVRVTCLILWVKNAIHQERVTEGQHQRCQDPGHHSHCLLCLLVSVLPHLHPIICGKGKSKYENEETHVVYNNFDNMWPGGQRGVDRPITGNTFYLQENLILSLYRLSNVWFAELLPSVRHLRSIESIPFKTWILIIQQFKAT